MQDQYVLLTKENTYYVEFLIGELVLSQSISEAMIFSDSDTAEKFKQMLFTVCELNCSINTYINQ